MVAGSSPVIVCTEYVAVVWRSGVLKLAVDIGSTGLIFAACRKCRL